MKRGFRVGRLQVTLDCVGDILHGGVLALRVKHGHQTIKSGA